MEKLRVEFKRDLSYRYQAHKVAGVEKAVFDACVHLKGEESNKFKGEHAEAEICLRFSIISTRFWEQKYVSSTTCNNHININ